MTVTPRRDMPLVGSYDRNALMAELNLSVQRPQSPEWYTLVRKAKDYLSTLEDEQIVALHADAGELLMNDLPQPPITYVIGVLMERTNLPQRFKDAEAADGPGVYVVTENSHNPRMRPCWIGYASDPVDALSCFAVEDGFVHYDNPDLAGSVHVWADDNGKPIGATAPFLNSQIWARKVDGQDFEPADGE